jgi:RimJ/RimL family protein N-acetyltransferase
MPATRRHPPPSERLIFRRWHADDLPLARSLWGDPRVSALISRAPLTDAQVHERLTAELTADDQHGVQYWPIFLCTTAEFVGCCGLRPHDPARGSLELGFHLIPAAWGQGLASEAARAVVAFAFTQFAAAALFAGHHPDNTASRHVLGKLGFRLTHSELYPATGLLHPSYWLTREDR